MYPTTGTMTMRIATMIANDDRDRHRDRIAGSGYILRHPLTSQGIEPRITASDTGLRQIVGEKGPRMTLFTRSLQDWRLCRVAVFCMLLGGALIAPAFGQTSSPRQTLYQRLGGYDGVASYVALVFPRVAQHPELRTCFADTGRTASSGSSNWSSS